MKILLTGANGYIGMRILPKLLELGHEVVCAVRDEKRLSVDQTVRNKIEVVEIDFLEEFEENRIPDDIEAAYFFIHLMSVSTERFDVLEARAAHNFIRYMQETSVRQVIYLSGIVNDKQLSKHLLSRKNVEDILYTGPFDLTVLRAGIIVGSGSSSFEIIRDLCEKLPFMITPKWVLTKSQPIAIRNVVEYLTGVLGNENTYNDSFDIGGADVLTYKEMLHQYAEVRGFKNWIWTIPVMTPKLSSYWLYFVTSTSYTLALNLVDSMKIEVIAQDKRLQELLDIKPYTYKEAIAMAFNRIEQNSVVSSWKDSMVSGRIDEDLFQYIQVPKYGVLRDKQSRNVEDTERTLNTIWSIGGGYRMVLRQLALENQRVHR